MKSNQSAEKLLRKNEIMKMPKKTIIILIMVIWVVTALAMIIGGGYFAYRTHDFLATAESTQGEIIKLKESRSSKGGISYKPIYTFTDKEGRKHTIRSNVSSFPAIGNVGDKVDVLYDPEHPTDAKINRFFNLWGLAAILGILGIIDLVIFLVIVIAMRWWDKKKQKKNQTDMYSAVEVKETETTATPEKKKSILVRNIRYGIYLFAFCMGIFNLYHEEHSSFFAMVYDFDGTVIKFIITIFILIMSFGFPYLAIFMVIGVQAVNPLSTVHRR